MAENKTLKSKYYSVKEGDLPRLLRHVEDEGGQVIKPARGIMILGRLATAPATHPGCIRSLVRGVRSGTPAVQKACLDALVWAYGHMEKETLYQSQFWFWHENIEHAPVAALLRRATKGMQIAGLKPAIEAIAKVEKGISFSTEAHKMWRDAVKAAKKGKELPYPEITKGVKIPFIEIAIVSAAVAADKPQLQPRRQRRAADIAQKRNIGKAATVARAQARAAKEDVLALPE